VLKPGREVQQQMVMIESLAHFERLEAEIGAIIAERGPDAMPDAELPVKVPSGPQERW